MKGILLTFITPLLQCLGRIYKWGAIQINWYKTIEVNLQLCQYDLNIIWVVEPMAICGFPVQTEHPEHGSHAELNTKTGQTKAGVPLPGTKPKPVQKKDPQWLQTHLGNPFLCFQANGLSVAEKNKRIWCKSHYFFQHHFLPPPPWITPPKKKPPNTFSRSQKSIPKTQKKWHQIVIREFPRQCREEAFFKSLDFKLLDFESVRVGAGLMGWCRSSVEHLCVYLFI